MEAAQSQIILQVIAALVAFIAMITDMKWGRIYNWLTFPAIFAGWLLNLALFGLSGLGYSFLATLAGIGLYIIPAAFGLVGMGDVKLMGAIGALGGSSFAVTVFLYTSALGIPHAILVQFLNYGRQAFSMLLTSFSTKAFLEKTIQKENQINQTNKNYRFLLGIDIFLATTLAIFFLVELKW
jgi:prepilin peptidase CpaA